MRLTQSLLCLAALITFHSSCAPASTPSAPEEKTAQVVVSHPLDPLTAAEIAAATRVIKALPDFPKEGRFSIVALREPAKEEVRAFKAGSPIPRQAFAVVLDRAGGRTFEAVVDITGNKAVSFNEVKGAQPLILEGEYETISRILKANPEWQQAMRKRGIEDIEKVQIDGWAAGQVAGAQPNARLM